MRLETTYRCVACKSRERWSELEADFHLCAKCHMPMVMESSKVTESDINGRIR